MPDCEMERKEIVVLGAGIVGLTVAYQLSQDARYTVKVIAKSLPIDPSQDYTSQYAGANWRSVCANDDHRMIDWERETLLYFRKFSKEHPDLVRECMAIDYFDPRDPDANDQRITRKFETPKTSCSTADASTTATTTAAIAAADSTPWFKEICPAFHELHVSELPPGATYGVTFDTVTINVPAYLTWLYTRCLHSGTVTFTQQTLTSFTELSDTDTVVMNCTGLGAARLTGDVAMYPTRGQTVLVKNTTGLRDTLSRVGQDYLSYLIPRPSRKPASINGKGFRNDRQDKVDGNHDDNHDDDDDDDDDGGLIIGGCQQPNNSSYAVDYALAEQMLEWARTKYPGTFPAHHAFKIIQHNVGMRPSRRGGARLEKETVDGRTFVHGYGIGGWGYQTSWGFAKRMIELL